VKLVAEGLRNREIAQRLFVTEGTVKLHLHNVYDKLGVDGRMELLLRVQDLTVPQRPFSSDRCRTHARFEQRAVLERHVSITPSPSSSTTFMRLSPWPPAVPRERRDGIERPGQRDLGFDPRQRGRARRGQFNADGSAAPRPPEPP
jgi:hypothetical protein